MAFMVKTPLTGMVAVDFVLGKRDGGQGPDPHVRCLKNQGIRAEVALTNAPAVVAILVPVAMKSRALTALRDYLTDDDDSQPCPDCGYIDCECGED